MATSTSSQQKLCANCNNPATHACTGCKEAPSIGDEVRMTYYCNAECQKSHWIKHKTFCRGLQERRNLFRVGGILQTMFYAYRERLYDKKIAKVEEKNGKFYIYEGKYYENIKTAVDLIDELFFPFPAGLLSNEKDRQTVLAHLTCDDALAYMADVARYLISSAVSSIMETGVSVRSPKRQTIAVDINGKEDTIDYIHAVWDVTLKHSKEQYFIDLSSAQHGYYEPVVPWSEYTASRQLSFHLDRLQELGDRIGFSKENATKAGHVGRIYRINLEMYKHLLRATMDWETNNKVKFREILKLPQNDFERKAKDLLDYVDKEISRSLESLILRLKSNVMGKY